MENCWKEKILEAFKQGKTIQANHNNREWTDFVTQNQLDRPNLAYGTEANWRIKPDYDAERREILKKVDKGEIMMEVPMPVSEIKPEDIWNDEKREAVKKIIREHKRNSPIEEAAQKRFPTHEGDIGLNASANYGFQEGAKWGAKGMYTKDQMFLFAGFCMGKKINNPGMDVGEILEEFERGFS